MIYAGNSLEFRDMAGRTHTNIPIKKLNLQKGQNFTLHYDYGDDWLFIIHTQSIDVADTEEAPRLLKSKGSVEQYPDYDDWDDDY